MKVGDFYGDSRNQQYWFLVSSDLLNISGCRDAGTWINDTEYYPWRDCLGRGNFHPAQKVSPQNLYVDLGDVKVPVLA